MKAFERKPCEPERIEAFIALVRGDLGYQLHSAVQQVKVELSQNECATFHFKDPEVDIEARVTRSQFESWISEELHAIEKSVDRVLNRAGVSAAQVDRVFLTGGSSFVPAVRRIFDLRFGHERITTGDEFTSVAHGLALRALSTRRSVNAISAMPSPAASTYPNRRREP